MGAQVLQHSAQTRFKVLPKNSPSRTENVTDTDNNNICVCQAGPILKTTYGSGAKYKLSFIFGYEAQ